MNGRFKSVFVWWPRRLARWESEDRSDGFGFIGWVWLQRAYLVNNIGHGWIAFADQQTEENLNRCPHCDKPLKGKQ